MKKLMMVALMMFIASATFAAESDALKAVMKAKTYAEASALLKSGLEQMTSPVEKAKAYNHLVQLAFEKYNAEGAIIEANLKAQAEQKPQTPYDTLGIGNAAYNILLDAIECNKYDQMPDAKGKVKPKYEEINRDLAVKARNTLVGIGNEYASRGDQDGVLKFWGAFLDTDDDPFLNVNKELEKAFIGQVAYYAALYANQAKMFDKALVYAEMAARDPEMAKEATNLKFGLKQDRLTSKEDTLSFINELKTFYAANPDSEAAFGTLCNLYATMDAKDDVIALVTDKLSKDPNNFLAWTLKAQNEMNIAQTAETPDWDTPIASFKKAVEIDGTSATVLTYLGFCINSKAAQISDNRNAQKELFKESLGYLERAKEIDPTREKANWAYPLYQCYYIVYSANDPRTKELEDMMKK